MARRASGHEAAVLTARIFADASGISTEFFGRERDVVLAVEGIPCRRPLAIAGRGYVDGDHSYFSKRDLQWMVAMVSDDTDVPGVLGQPAEMPAGRMLASLSGGYISGYAVDRTDNPPVYWRVFGPGLVVVCRDWKSWAEAVMENGPTLKGKKIIRRPMVLAPGKEGGP